MKNILGAFVLLLFLFGCTEADQEDRFVGRWLQVNTSNGPKLSADITKVENGYLVEMTMSLPNQAPVKMSQVGQYKDGMLQADGLEKIRIVPTTGHIMIGVNEFELVK